MSDSAELEARLAAWIFRDEVGLYLAVLEDARLRTRYQPVLACSGETLKPVAVASELCLHRQGREMPADAYVSTLPAPDQCDALRLANRLHLLNLQNAAEGDLDLHLELIPPAGDDGSWSIEETALLLAFARSIELEPRRLTIEISAVAEFGTPALMEIAARLREGGVRVALDLPVIANLPAQPSGKAAADVAKLSGAWFSVACSNAASERLLLPMAESLHRQGIRTSVEAIASPAQMRSALAAGFDLFQGPLLGPAALAGSDIFEELQIPPQWLGRSASILPLFGNSSTE